MGYNPVERGTGGAGRGESARNGMLLGWSRKGPPAELRRKAETRMEAGPLNCWWHGWLPEQNTVRGSNAAASGGSDA